MIQSGQKYRHYKGNQYQVVALAKHSETLEPLVIYQDLSNPSKTWARPQPMFEDTLENGTKRFTLIG